MRRNIVMFLQSVDDPRGVAELVLLQSPEMRRLSTEHCCEVPVAAVSIEIGIRLGAQAIRQVNEPAISTHYRPHLQTVAICTRQQDALVMSTNIASIA